MFNKIILLVSVCLFSNYVAADDFTVLWRHQKSNNHEYLNSKELLKIESTFEFIFINGLNDKLKNVLAALKFNVSENKKFIVISESMPPYSGKGIYIIRKQADLPTLIQAPHGFYDIKTADIAIKLMQENSIRALSINTVHRRYADMAHLNDTVFLAFVRAFSSVYKKSNIIQLHGFNENKRVHTQSVDFILSNGSSVGYQRLLRQSECIDRKLRVNTEVYPLQISVLGGTKNTTGQMLRSRKHRGFEHVEMGSKIRQNLKRSKRSRRLFSACLFK